MDLKSLSVEMMLNLTGDWLADKPDNAFLTGMQQGGPLAAGFLGRMQQSHGRLLSVDDQRRKAELELQEMIQLGTSLDQLHDRKARSMFHHFGGLIEGADSPEQVAEYQDLRDELFAQGLRVIQLPFIEEGGAAVALDHRIGEKARAKLAEITVGEQTMLALFEAWIDAGKRLGQASKRRAELEAALGRQGSKKKEIDVQAARFEWIKTIRGLLWVLESEEPLAPLAEGVIAALEHGIAISQRRRVAGDGEFGEGGGGGQGGDEGEADEAEADEAEADEDEAQDAADGEPDA